MMDRSLPPVGPDGRTPLRLLFVEDSRDDAELLERMLAQGGYRVEAHRVQDEPALRAALATGPFDVVLGDHSLPALSSLRALALVHEQDPDTPFLVVSGTIREEDAVALMKAGASDYLLKDRLGRLVPAVRREMLEARNRRAHRAARAEIERSEAQYRSLIDNAVVGVFHADASGRFTFVNQALVGMLGYPTAAALRDVEPATAVFEEAGVLAGLLGRGLSSPISGLEAGWRTRDGRSLLVRLSGRVVEREGGACGLEMFVEDVTERRLLQQQLLQAQKMEVVGQLAGGVAHDFNNLLVAILGYAELARAALGDGHPQAPAIDQIRRAGDRAAGLTRRLLAFSRQEVSRPTAIDLAAVARDLLGMLAPLLGETVRVVVRAEDDVPPVLADRGQLEQVLVNLAVNARDAMPGGGEIVIEVARSSPDETSRLRPAPLPPGSYVRLSVVDTGEGMTEETKAHLFEPFFTTKPPGKGTGLGLSMVYGVVAQCGGGVAVQSTRGLGTSLHLHLPVAPADLLGSVPVDPAAATSPTRSQRGGERILVVEDSPAVRQLTAALLEAAGYAVETAEDGTQALAMLARDPERYDLLFTDMVLPDVTGLELVAQARASRPGLRAVLTSGYTAESIDRLELARSRDPFVEKPFRNATLLEKVREALDGPAPPAGGTASRGSAAQDDLDAPIG